MAIGQVLHLEGWVLPEILGKVSGDAMIRLKGDNGFEAVVNPDKVTAYGIDPPVAKRLWVICDGRQYAVGVDVDEQFQVVDQVMKGFAGRISVKGIGR